MTGNETFEKKIAELVDAKTPRLLVRTLRQMATTRRANAARLQAMIRQGRYGDPQDSRRARQTVRQLIRLARTIEWVAEQMSVEHCPNATEILKGVIEL